MAATKEETPTRESSVPMAPAFRIPAPKRRDGDEATSTYRIPVDKQTCLVYDAFLSLSTVAILHEESDVMALVVAEKAEFKAAVGQGDTDPMAAPPRRYAMTLLIPQSATSCSTAWRSSRAPRARLRRARPGWCA